MYCMATPRTTSAKSEAVKAQPFARTHVLVDGIEHAGDAHLLARLHLAAALRLGSSLIQQARAAWPR